MKRGTCLIGFGIFLFFLEATSFAADQRLSPVVKTQYFQINGFQGMDLYTLLAKINFNYLLRVDQINAGKNKNFKSLLTRTMDALYLEVTDILRVQIPHFQVQINFYEDQGGVAAAYADLYQVDFKETSFYHPQTNTIHISFVDLTLSQLGFEVARAVLAHYFVVPPSANIQDVLAGYVQYNLRKATNVTPEGERMVP